MTLGQHQQMFTRDLCMLLMYAFDQGYEVRMGEVERPLAMQEIYFKTGRSKTMDSRHLKKCAADLHFFKDGQICYPVEMGAFWESLNPLNNWGGNWTSFKDGPHFERRV
jgi:peptidoglycan L-alanyl-D-glutamate endopeptidase CwlK